MSVIKWPTMHLPYIATPRGAVFAAAIQSRWILITIGIGVLTLAIYHRVTVVPDPADPVAFGSRFFWLLVELSAGALILISVLSLRALTTDGFAWRGLTGTKRWRKEWEALEKSTNTFETKLWSVHTSQPPPPEMLQHARSLPIRQLLHLAEYKDSTFPTMIPSTDRTNASHRDQFLTILARDLSAWTVPHATAIESGTLTRIQMLDDSTQLWSRFRIDDTGWALSVQLQTGIMWWDGRTTLADGSLYRGDIATLRNASNSNVIEVFGKPISNPLLLPVYAMVALAHSTSVWAGFLGTFILLCMLLSCCMCSSIFHILENAGSSLRPISVLLLVLPITLYAVFRCGTGGAKAVRELAVLWPPEDGDATDLIALTRLRNASPLLPLSGERRLALESARNEISTIIAHSIKLMQSLHRRS